MLTERPGHGIELASAADGDALLVLSGDGGFNEVLNGARAGIPLAFLPGGGANVLSRALGLPRDPAAAARQVGEALEAGRTRTISVGRVNGRRFSFSAGLGFDSELVRRVDARGRRDDGKRPGDTAFIAAALGLVAERRLRFEPVLEVGGLGRAAFALVANTDPYTYAGAIPIHVAAEARFELGLDLFAPKRVTATTLPRLLRHLVTGKGVESATSSTATTWTGSRSPATGRCRCRSTARISATSSTRSSRPSAARSPCLSRVSAMSGSRRLVLSGIALTALLAVVALASHAHRPGGGTGGGSAQTPKLIFEYGATVMFILMPFGILTVLWVASFGRRQKLLEGGDRSGRSSGRSSPSPWSRSRSRS